MNLCLVAGENKNPGSAWTKPHMAMVAPFLLVTLWCLVPCCLPLIEGSVPATVHYVREDGSLVYIVFASVWTWVRAPSILSINVAVYSHAFQVRKALHVSC